ncbi:MAG: hypothetical protein ACI4DP_03260 [Candidatus Ornithomonoglobus sp.]
MELNYDTLKTIIEKERLVQQYESSVKSGKEAMYYTDKKYHGCDMALLKEMKTTGYLSEEDFIKQVDILKSMEIYRENAPEMIKRFSELRDKEAAELFELYEQYHIPEAQRINCLRRIKNNKKRLSTKIFNVIKKHLIHRAKKEQYQFVTEASEQDILFYYTCEHCRTKFKARYKKAEGITKIPKLNVVCPQCKEKATVYIKQNNKIEQQEVDNKEKNRDEIYIIDIILLFMFFIINLIISYMKPLQSITPLLSSGAVSAFATFSGIALHIVVVKRANNDVMWLRITAIIIFNIILLTLRIMMKISYTNIVITH